MDKGLHTGIIFIDLQREFDTLDHDVLLEKMECMGFKNQSLNDSNPIFQTENFL